MLFKRFAIYVACFMATWMSTGSFAEESPLNRELLHTAASGNAADIRALLDQGAVLEARDERGRTALLVATHENNVAAAQALIDAGADVNAKDAIQDSAYLYAGARGLNEILEMTLAHGADLKSTN